MKYISESVMSAAVAAGIPKAAIEDFDSQIDYDARYLHFKESAPDIKDVQQYMIDENYSFYRQIRWDMQCNKQLALTGLTSNSTIKY